MAKPFTKRSAARKSAEDAFRIKYLNKPTGRKKKGKKNGKEADARKAVARGKLKKGLMKMHDSWSPKTAEGKAYDADLKSFIDGLEA